MARTFFFLLLLAVVSVPFAVTPAAAQFGTIFGSPPRPPQDVPRQRDPWQPLPPPHSGLPPPEAQPSPQGGVQSQPLPPPPGSSAVPPAAPNRPPQPSFSDLPPGQRQPAPPQPADTELQAGDEVVAEPPARKVENPVGVFSGLDKITGRITSFEAAIGETVQFGALQVTPRACYTRPPTETPHTDAFIEVDEVTLKREIRRIFTGWMFAASPGLHAVDHPIYDVWLTDCKGGVVAEAEAPEEPPPRAASRDQPPPSQRQRRTP